MVLDLDYFHFHGYAKFTAPSQKLSTIEIAEMLGTVSLAPGLNPSQRLIPRTTGILERSSYSGNFGLESFPLHTDMAHWSVPPRFFILRCIHPANNVRTLFLHSATLIAGEDDLNLSRALFRPRRLVDGKLTLLKLATKDFVRWDSLFIIPMNKPAFELKTRIEAKISCSEVHQENLDEVDSCLLIDNWKVLHGRSPVSSDDKIRIIERVYLKNLRGIPCG